MGSPRRLLSLMARRNSLEESALRMASSKPMWPASYSSKSAQSKVRMPSSRDFSMMPLISPKAPLKIFSAMVGVFSKISIAALRPLPSSVRMRRCDTMERRLADRSISNWLRRSSGKKLMMRSIA